MSTTEGSEQRSDNELIADFLNLERSDVPWDNGEYGYTMKFPSVFNKWVIPSQMKFHTSWDWLMPVVEKINKYCDDIIALSTDWHIKYIRPIKLALMRTDIEKANKAVVEFIKWYNIQKP